jgi:hypothetical protein
MLWMHVGECAFANLADAARCAAGVDDEGFSHGMSPGLG